MAKYQFTALDLENRKINGTVDARDDDDFRRIMRGKGLVPVKHRTMDERRAVYRLKANEVSEFCRQLASMLSSGITAVRAMEIIKERDFKNAKLKRIYEALHKDIQQGITMSEAMRQQGRAFPELLVNMFASGEASGQLENVTDKMSVHYEKEHRLNGKIRSAMNYPMILGVITVAVVIGIFTLVLPEFFKMLSDIPQPTLTKAVIAISDFMTQRWYIIIIVVLSFMALIAYLLKVPAVRLKFDQTKLKLPVIGKLLYIIYTARFARTLSSLYSSGVSMIKALEISGTIIGNKYIESQFPAVIRDVRNGEALSASVRKVNGFDNKLPNTILIGEEAGRLETMLVSTADSFDYEAEQATGRLVQLVEPAMLIIMAAIILTVMLSVMMPLMSLYSNPDLL
ncbi:MAG: type II secretion system F family protein [Oscillospiraceae bacterium]|jgi:type IV pilus assembly protein PilC|nr:type II secretion system F family protein [Oscillospiraceae bacterium]